MSQIILAITALLFSVTLAEFIQSDHRLGEDLSGGLSEYRQLILRQNSLRIEAHNSDPTKSWKLKLYPRFAALTPSEVRSSYFPKMSISQDHPKIDRIKEYQLNILKAQKTTNYEYINLAAVYATPIIDQGSCKSSPAFATIGAVDIFFKSKYANKNYPLLSPQHLIDCSKGFYNNGGCQYGNLFASFYFLHLYGVVSQRAYPYRYSTQWGGFDTKKCQFTKALRYKINSFFMLGENQMKHPNDADCSSQRDLLRAGYPLTVSLSVTFQVYSYANGVISNCTMPSDFEQIDYNHNVVMVGFQASPIYEENYVILRNSWGISWGQRGYFKVFDPPQCQDQGCFDQEGRPIDSKIFNKCFVCNYAYVPA